MADVRTTGAAAAPAAGVSTRLLVPACAVLTIVSAWVYGATMLHGVDLGDTGGFQAAVSSGVSARQAYPLYFALGHLFVRLTGGSDPAFALNLMSVAFGAIAVGLLTWVAARMTGIPAVGIVAGAWLAVSYTFWTQAIIAEVYTLHLAFIGLCLAAILAWRDRPTVRRLVFFFAAYALAFGNHLSMILLLPGFALYLLAVAPGGPRSMLRSRVVVPALALALAGALQYVPNLRAAFDDPLPPRSWADGMSTFWFEVTKADWRETMVMAVQTSELANRAGMWWFDLRQQFGIVGILAAGAGAIALWRTRRHDALLVTALWLVNTVFAITYNVGDTHVFYLPSHYVVALWIGCALLPLGATFGGGLNLPFLATSRLSLFFVGLLAVAGWRAYDTWPAVDRHDDQRAFQAAARLGAGLSEDHAILGAQLNWQAENALLYYSRCVRPDLVWFRTQDTTWQLPWLVRDNAAADRDVVLTRAAADAARAAFGAALTFTLDRANEPSPLPSIAARIPRGAVYVVALLHPYPDQPLDRLELERTLTVLGATDATVSTDAQFTVIVGRAGYLPVVRRVEPHPFRQRIAVDGLDLEVRMESWLPTDTFRRAGFGHVVVNHRHAATFDRGVTLVSLTSDGRVGTLEYRAGLYAPESRWVVSLARTDERPVAGQVLPLQ